MPYVTGFFFLVVQQYTHTLGRTSYGPEESIALVRKRDLSLGSLETRRPPYQSRLLARSHPPRAWAVTSHFSFFPFSFHVNS